MRRLLLKLPSEVFNIVLSEIDSTSDLASLSATCRRLYTLVIPRLYSHTILTIPHSDIDISDEMEEQIPKWMVLLQTLARYRQRVTVHVKKLTIRNPARFNKYHHTDSHDLLAHHQSGVACYDPDILANHKLAFMLNSVLEVALHHMKNLTDFTWTADNVYPTNSVFDAIRSPLSSFSFHYPYYPQPLTTTCPSHFGPALPNHKLDSITSLSISGIPSKQAVKQISKLLVSLRNQLKVLRLGFPNVPWELGSESNWILYRRNRNFMDSNDDPPSRDHLFLIIEELIELNEPIKLHTLEVDYIMEVDVNHWSKAFDFNTIEKFSLTHTSDKLPRPSIADFAPVMWRYFRENGIIFKSFKTDCDPFIEELSRYMMSFEGLEELYLCSFNYSPAFLDFQGHFHSLRILFLPKLNCVLERPEKTLPMLIEGAPNLEELAISIAQYNQEIYFQAFSQSHSLKRLYLITYIKDWVCHDVLANPRTYDKFIRSFFNYYHDNPCPFFDRLEMLSCFRTLWELVPVDLTYEERKEMEYELMPESNYIPDDMKLPDWPPPRRDIEGFDLLQEPYCYSWERALSGFDKMPMRVDWDAYWEDELISTVYDYIMLPCFEKPYDREMSDWNERVIIDGYVSEDGESEDNQSYSESDVNDEDGDGGGDGDSNEDGDDDEENGKKKEDGEEADGGDEGNEDGNKDTGREDSSQHIIENDQDIKPKRILPIYGAKEGEHEDFA